MPMLKAAISMRESFNTLTHATARMPLAKTNPATMTNAINMASGRLIAWKLATSTMMPSPVSCNCR